MTVDSILLLGRDYSDYGELHVNRVGTRSAAAISVGADRQSPSRRFKGDLRVPNEDALCVVDAGDSLVLGVADAHFGHESSHRLIERLAVAVTATMPANAAELDQVIESLGEGPGPETKSESTLLIALVDRKRRAGHVVSFGDSTLAVVTEAGGYQQVNVKDDRYVAPGDLWPIGGGSVNKFDVSPGDVVLAFTDGIDECHYRNPDTSVQPDEIGELVRSASGQPELIAERLARMALDGVDGNPGGQDNIALIVVRA